MRRQEWYLASLIVLLSISFFEQCAFNNKEDTVYVRGKGPIISKDLSLDSIYSVSNEGIGDFNITTGAIEQKITLKAQQNIIDYMTYGVTDGVFIWGYKEKLKIDPLSQPIVVEIELKGEVQEANLLGVGNIHLTGPKQQKLVIVLQGFGNIFGYDIETEEGNISLPGVGNCQVRVNKKLTGLISGQGNIYYKGNPEIQCPITGIGRIINSN